MAGSNPHVHFHFTPIGSSWINQIETWFGIITRQSIRRGTFASVTVLVKQIRDYIDALERRRRSLRLDRHRRRDPRQGPLVQTNVKQTRRQQREVKTTESQDTSMVSLAGIAPDKMLDVNRAAHREPDSLAGSHAPIVGEKAQCLQGRFARVDEEYGAFSVHEVGKAMDSSVTPFAPGRMKVASTPGKARLPTSGSWTRRLAVVDGTEVVLLDPVGQRVDLAAQIAAEEQADDAPVHAVVVRRVEGVGRRACRGG